MAVFYARSGLTLTARRYNYHQIVIFEIVWPEQVRFIVNGRETLNFRNGDKLYFKVKKFKYIGIAQSRKSAGPIKQILKPICAPSGTLVQHTPFFA